MTEHLTSRERVAKGRAEVRRHAANRPGPPFVIRGRLLTPLRDGGTLFEPDGAVALDATGRIAFAGSWPAWRRSRDEAARGPDATTDGPVLDHRPSLILPGLVDLHAHLPQIPNAGLGSGLHLLEWLERYIYPLERAFDAATAARLAPAAFAAFAAAGTTTVVLYGAAWPDSLDEAFAAAERHGIRAVIGKVMMDRVSYRDVPPARRLEMELRESADLCARWHGRDGGRLAYAFTPRFAVSCTAELLRESAALAAAAGAYWQTHLSEDRGELDEVRRLFPEARDYVDVYDRAAALGPRSLMAHAIHLSDAEIARLAETRTRVAHCPESNAYLSSGTMRLARYREAGVVVGLGSDVAGGPSMSIFRAMRAAAYAEDLVRVAEGRPRASGPLDLLRLGTIEGARTLGLEDTIGSLEAGKDGDLIVVDPCLTAPLPGLDVAAPDELIGRLVFRTHPDMVRGAWVRGRPVAIDPGRAGPDGP